MTRKTDTSKQPANTTHRASYPLGIFPEFREVGVELISPGERLRGCTLQTIHEARRAIADLLSRSCVERAAVVLLSKHCKPMGYSIVSMGSEYSCSFSLGELARLCLLSGAPYFMLAHNHISTLSPTPSPQDDASAQEVWRTVHYLDLKMIDFLIVGSDASFYSYRQHERMPFTTYCHDDDDEDDEDEDDTDDPDEPEPKARAPNA